ncbi:MAG: TSUP family transporter [Flammeovirgaceae bacterium]
MLTIVWVSLVALAVWFSFVLVKDFLAHRNNLENSSWLETSLIGFVVNFFDVLGIGAFAPQTALLKFTKQTEDKLIPGTMNVANTLPVILQAFIFITIIEVDPLTLILMLVSAAVGAVIGADIVSKLSERKIRLTMGFALLITATFMVARMMNWIQGGGEAIGLTDYKLVVAVVVNFFLGGYYLRRNAQYLRGNVE